MKGTKPLRLLVVEDSSQDTFLLVRELQRGGYAPQWERVDTPAAMTTALDRQSWAEYRHQSHLRYETVYRLSQ